MNHLPLIIKREYLAKVKNKSFLLMTFLSPLIMVGFISLVTYLATVNNETIRTISVLDESEFFKETLSSTEYTKYHYLDGVDLESAKSLSNQASSYGLLYIPNLPIDSVSEEIKFLSEDAPSLTFITNLESKIENRIKELKLEKSGVDLAKIKAANTNVNLGQESYEGVKTSKAGSFMKLAFGFFAGYLLLMFIIIYGNLIMRSVIEEKNQSHYRGYYIFCETNSVDVRKDIWDFLSGHYSIRHLDCDDRSFNGSLFFNFWCRFKRNTSTRNRDRGHEQPRCKF
jgi:ABC-2 type transport system permease protein